MSITYTNIQYSAAEYAKTSLFDADISVINMAKINLLDTRTTSFGGLIGNGKIYKVPDFQRDYSDIQLEEMVYYIGNLTPLEPSLNRQVGNELYPIKQEAYQKSVYTLTNNILAEEWTPDTIAARQKRLSQRAVHIWKSDFAT